MMTDDDDTDDDEDELLACRMGSLKIHEQIRNGGGKRSMEVLLM
jgi:hypothetical protein